MRVLALIAFVVGLWCFGEAFYNLGSNDRLAGLWAVTGCINMLINLLCVNSYSKQGA